MINRAMLEKKHQFNEFTIALQMICEREQGCYVQLRDGSIHRVVYEVAAEALNAVFRTEDWEYAWREDGSSITSPDYDIVALGRDIK